MKMKKHTTGLILILLLTIIFGTLLILSLWQGRKSDEPLMELVKSETIFIILILLFTIPVFLLLLINQLLKKPEKIKIDKIEVETEEESPKPQSEPLTLELGNIIGPGPLAFDNKNDDVTDLSDDEESTNTLDDEAIRNSILTSKINAKAQVKTDHQAEGMESTEKTGRFYVLKRLDEEYASYEAPLYQTNLSLEEICNEFRNFSAGKLGLYYDISDIRRFIASLAVTKLIILQGMSGTGKTSLAYAFGEFVENQTVVVPIQPMWKERTDLIGYYNEFTKKFNETTLLEKLYEAGYNDNIYITVLDEMNIARVEYYFAEFLSLLELPNPNSRFLDVVSDKWVDDPIKLREGKLHLPDNMWFIGTANNDDSTFAISDKVYDRAMVINLDNKAKVFEAPSYSSHKISSEYLVKTLKKATREYRISNRNMGRIQVLDEYMIEKFHITFGNRIMKQMKAYVPAYIACGGSETEAIDDIMARKVMRKLESQNPIYVKAQAEPLCQFLDELFGENQMALCKESIKRIARQA